MRTRNLTTLTPLVLLLSISCSTSSQRSSNVVEDRQTFAITWENMDKFQDAPEFDDASLDDPPRFVKNPRYGDPYYFKDGKIEVDLQGAKGKAAAEKVVKWVSARVLGDSAHSRITTLAQTRFGYYAYVDWGYAEEKHTGHMVRIMIDLDSRTIWWMKCS